MTVRELIAELSKLDGDLPVYVADRAREAEVEKVEIDTLGNPFVDNPKHVVWVL